MCFTDAEVPELLPIGYLVGDTTQIGICLKGECFTNHRLLGHRYLFTMCACINMFVCVCVCVCVRVCGEEGGEGLHFCDVREVPVCKHAYKHRFILLYYIKLYHIVNLFLLCDAYILTFYFVLRNDQTSYSICRVLVHSHIPCPISPGTRQQSVDSLAFETMIPKSIIQRYVSLLLEHRRIILCGPSGTGKTYLAQKLAEHLVLR